MFIIEFVFDNSGLYNGVDIILVGPFSTEEEAFRYRPKKVYGKYWVERTVRKLLPGGLST